MNPDDQRIAIAEACGLERCHPYDKFSDFTPRWYWKGGYYCFEELPDYLDDLNAMHEAEKTLDDTVDMTDSDKVRYSENLGWIMVRKFVWEATATQRAEAFLKTLNLWKEQK